MREQVFWGWGEPGAGPSLSAHTEPLLRAQLGVVGGVVDRPVALEDVRLRPPALPEAARARLVAAVGTEHVRDDRAARVLRCRGKSYLDLLAQRAGDCEAAPDAVVAPADPEQVAAVLRACSEAGVAQSSATTCSSMRPWPVEVWPAERVATQPPTLAHS